MAIKHIRPFLLDFFFIVSFFLGTKCPCLSLLLSIFRGPPSSSSPSLPFPCFDRRPQLLFFSSFDHQLPSHSHHLHFSASFNGITIHCLHHHHLTSSCCVAATALTPSSAVSFLHRLCCCEFQYGCRCCACRCC